MQRFLGYMILVVFILLLLDRIDKGPFIYQSGTTHFINIKDLQFDKSVLNIKAGDRVVFTNYDNFRHSIINNNPNINNSKLLMSFDKYEHTFSKPETILFSSSLYDNMNTTKIIVEEVVRGNSYYNSLKNNLINLVKTIIDSIFYSFWYLFKR
jgi:plastocyanin